MPLKVYRRGKGRCRAGWYYGKTSEGDYKVHYWAKDSLRPRCGFYLDRDTRAVAVDAAAVWQHGHHVVEKAELRTHDPACRMCAKAFLHDNQDRAAGPVRKRVFLVVYAEEYDLRAWEDFQVLPLSKSTILVATPAKMTLSAMTKREKVPVVVTLVTSNIASQQQAPVVRWVLQKVNPTHARHDLRRSSELPLLLPRGGPRGCRGNRTPACNGHPVLPEDELG